MSDLLSDDEIADLLPQGWDHDGDEIVRVYEFADYLRGVNFAQMVGEIAEAHSHHPELTIRYEELEIRLTTHEEGGVTDRDVELASVIEAER
ncbi:4a-hydroxytetrahydrobiopterin dehydratase [Natrialbaceae archaeon AArc-T1-2]|uniref:4a-hydroxytetrahydrobiopterin dehydratase n=1 Tax=Natrialbaceae archaeon AArc-T1-2 TaxID=3053904 RepID=UPI00255AC9AA|nr:4a-hydroxytetrahydrobiopterin dehydratase [Natrialbaceae archaeon AArc-T1-2]WIV68006.1 4a-hydroxytetrahydrobiopterin dehydratase [Natrialbaceae archaeon AArc-T1-2]